MTDTIELVTKVNQAIVPFDEPHKAQARRRYEIIKVSECLEDDSPIEWIIDGLIQRASVNLVYGDSASGKTYLLFDAGVCMAVGKKWLGFAVKQGAVLVIDEESGKRRYKRRIRETVRGHNADSNTPIYAVSMANFNFGNPEDKPADFAELTNLIYETGAQLVIIDSLTATARGKNQNNVEDMQPYFHELRRIAEETGVAFIVIHHSNRNGTMRGTTGIPAAIDYAIKVEKKENNALSISTTKERDSAPVQFAAQMNFDIDEYGKVKAFWLTASETQKISSSAFTKAERYVLLYLFEHGESASKDMTGKIDPHVDPAPKSISNSISTLKQNGLIERTDTGGTSTGTYKLTLKGEEAAESL